MRAQPQPAGNGFAPRESAAAQNAIAFRIQGNGLPPVIFLHGVGLNKHAWQKQQEFFAPRRITIACDLPGHGNSPTPTHSHSRSHSPDTPDLSDYTTPVADLMDELGFQQADIVGHSFGGLAALDFALRFPQKTRRIVVLNGVFRRPPKAKTAALRRAKTLASGNPSQSAETAEIALRRWFGDSWDDKTTAIANEVRQWLLAANPSGHARAYQLFAKCDADFAPRLHRLAVPALFATGENDPHSTAEMTREMARIAPKGQCAILPGQRHMAALAAPEIVNPILMRFLNSPAPPTPPAPPAPANGEKT